MLAVLAPISCGTHYSAHVKFAASSMAAVARVARVRRERTQGARAVRKVAARRQRRRDHGVGRIPLLDPIDDGRQTVVAVGGRTAGSSGSCRG